MMVALAHLLFHAEYHDSSLLENNEPLFSSCQSTIQIDPLILQLHLLSPDNDPLCVFDCIERKSSPRKKGKRRENNKIPQCA